MFALLYHILYNNLVFYPRGVVLCPIPCRDLAEMAILLMLTNWCSAQVIHKQSCTTLPQCYTNNVISLAPDNLHTTCKAVCRLTG